MQSDGTELDGLDDPSSATLTRPKARASSNIRSIRPHDSLFGKKTVVSTEFYGDGTELDHMKDLSVSPDLTRTSSNASSISKTGTLPKRKVRLFFPSFFFISG